MNQIDWQKVAGAIDSTGCAVVSGLLTPMQCRELTENYREDARFRKSITMASHGFGRGEYKYFAYPLPTLIEELRTSLYPELARIANTWGGQYPNVHADFLTQCHEAGQTKPTPLLLKYGENDYNCLHQDLYGDLVFPLQIAFLLSEPGRDFAGGEFVLTEQRPRMQSRVEVVLLKQGDAVVFPVHHRPVQGLKRTYRVNMRHGVSRIRAGSNGASRFTLGIIFHDAK